MTNQEVKNKHLDLDADSDGKAESGRSSPYIREKHQKQHHSHDHANGDDQDGRGGAVETDGDGDGHPESTLARKQRNKHLGRKIQHGLQKSSSRNTGLPLDCYIGLAFRVLKTKEEIERYKSQVRGASKSQVDLEKGEQLLTWQAVVSDGKHPIG